MKTAIDTPAVATPVLEIRGLSKSFPGVQALKNVSLSLQAGEVLALVGENGAGKSTLLKILAGAQPADSGEIFLDGRPTEMVSPVVAQRAGISIIYQEFNLVPDLTVGENIFLGREITRAGFVRGQAETRQAHLLFERIGIAIDPRRRCGDLTVAEQQIVEIAKALSLEARILVMDEPSATLTQREVTHLFAIIRDLQAQGLGIIYVSHRLEEVFAVADRVMVLRDGAEVATQAVGRLSRRSLVEQMVGRDMEREFPVRDVPRGAERLRVSRLNRFPVVRDVHFSVHAGEVLGIAGLVGAGRTETMRLIFGADRRDDGDILVNGKSVDIQSPRDALRQGICLLTEDRKGQGLVLGHSVLDNFGLPNLNRFKSGLFVNRRRQQEAFSKSVGELNIAVAGPHQLAMTLSGGNQQKVVLAKWLARNTDILIFDEPTRGIDVGAKYELYCLMNELAARGKAIIMVSSELPEILGMSDRILVMQGGRIRGEITDVTSATQEDVLSLAMGPEGTLGGSGDHA